MAKSSSSYSGSNPADQFGFTTSTLGDWQNALKYQSPNNYGTLANPTLGSAASPYSAPQTNPINPGVGEDWEKYFKLYSALGPLRLQEQQAQAKFGAEATRQQMADLYPYLSAASAEATARNLAASTQFLLTKEQTPTAQALRNQVAQGQMATAAGAEAERDRATATQAMAAKEFARGYAGQTFRMT
jgi:hypothetical protein